MDWCISQRGEFMFRSGDWIFLQEGEFPDAKWRDVSSQNACSHRRKNLELEVKVVLYNKLDETTHPAALFAEEH